VLLVGAEMNAEIEHASEYGKDVGEKVPGQKRKIGPALQREWEKRRGTSGRAPSAKEIKDQVRTPAATGRAPAPALVYAAPQGGLLDRLLAIPIVIAQAVLTLRFWRRTRA